MAGWIKVESNLKDKVEVQRLVRILSASCPHDVRIESGHVSAVVGALVLFWSWCDTNFSDGVTSMTIDEARPIFDAIVGIDGFTDAMCRVGWLFEDSGSGEVVVPNYDRHMDKNAKRRALDSQRKADSRSVASAPSPHRVRTESASCPHDVRMVSASEADKRVTREDERREEDEEPPVVPQGGTATGQDSSREARSKQDRVDWQRHLEHAQELHREAPGLEVVWNRMTTQRKRLLRRRAAEIGIAVSDPDALWERIRSVVLPFHDGYFDGWRSGKTLDVLLRVPTGDKPDHWERYQAAKSIRERELTERDRSARRVQKTRERVMAEAESGEPLTDQQRSALREGLSRFVDSREPKKPERSGVA